MRTTIKAEPEAITIELTRTALLIIDMQRDFLEPGGFGETLGNDVSLLTRAIAPCKAILETFRAAGLLVIHTREGHRPDLSDAPIAKVERGHPSMRIARQKRRCRRFGALRLPMNRGLGSKQARRV